MGFNSRRADLTLKALDDIWDEPDAGHTTSNTPGNTLRNLDNGLINVTNVTGTIPSVIKSIQRGQITLTVGESNDFATITAVVMAKSIVIMTGNIISGTQVLAEIWSRLVLTNTTTVTLSTSNAQDSGDTLTAPYQVIEYE